MECSSALVLNVVLLVFGEVLISEILLVILIMRHHTGCLSVSLEVAGELVNL